MYEIELYSTFRRNNIGIIFFRVLAYKLLPNFLFLGVTTNRFLIGPNSS